MGRARRDHRDRRALQRREVTRHKGGRCSADAELAVVRGAPAVDVALRGERERVRLAARDLRDRAVRERLHQLWLIAARGVAVAELAALAAAERVHLARVRERDRVLRAKGDLREHAVEAAQLAAPFLLRFVAWLSVERSAQANGTSAQARGPGGAAGAARPGARRVVWRNAQARGQVGVRTESSQNTGCCERERNPHEGQAQPRRRRPSHAGAQHVSPSALFAPLAGSCDCLFRAIFSSAAGHLDMPPPAAPRHLFSSPAAVASSTTTASLALI